MSSSPGLEKEVSTLVHALNGRLLRELDEQLGLLQIDWEPANWIINVIVLQRLLGRLEQSELRTSATLYKGKDKIFDDPSRLDIDEGVGDLGRPVPLYGSFSGYCIRTGNVVWVDDTDMQPWHPLRNEYRAFEYVGVIPDLPAAAEYVFPIRLKVGTSEAMLGVLNMEWFRAAESRQECEFRTSRKRDAITHTIIHLLDAHGPFLALASVPEVENKDFPGTATQCIRDAHEAALRVRTQILTQWIEEEVKSYATDQAASIAQ